MQHENEKEQFPSSFKLHHTLRGHKNVITKIAWSSDGRFFASPSFDGTIRLWDVQSGQHLRTFIEQPHRITSASFSMDGRFLASSSYDRTVQLWDVQSGQHLRTFKGHSDTVHSVIWSPTSYKLASCSDDGEIQLWQAQTGQLVHILRGHSRSVNRITWSPREDTIASCSDDGEIQLWQVQTGLHLRTLVGHTGYVFSIAWSPVGNIIVSSSQDRTIQIWNPLTGQPIRTLEGHTDWVTCVSFSSDYSLLASKSRDGTVRIWHTDTWEIVAILEESSSGYWSSCLAFHPKAPILATLGENDEIIRIWDLDLVALLGTPPIMHSVHYTNAKIVLVGDSGVGKSGLGLVLTGQPFAPTESTHGRRIWTFENQEKIKLAGGREETRETLLWDLAGQPGYRLIHQLHLNEVAVALVIFDSRSETDPFAGVHHWTRALNMAQRIQGTAAPPLKKLLVAARIDRGRKSVSRERINTLLRELEFDGYFETSAKEGLNISPLIEAIKNLIDWNTLPKVTSTDLFQQIKAFLIAEKEAGRLLSTIEDLYRSFLKSEDAPDETQELKSQFETCIGRVESKGLIRRLSFGKLVLMQPELLDVYASALVEAVKDEPDGLGSISEERVKASDFLIPKDERITDREQENLLLIAMVEDLLRYEIVLREQGEDGAYLVFPSQSTRENPDLPNPEGKEVIFRFEGPVLNIYATLAVRLSHSSIFKKKELWKNAVTYTTKMGGTYGIFLLNLGEGRAELTLFFDNAAKEETRLHFEEYIRTHLQRRAIPDSIHQRRIFVCPDCATPLDDLHVQRRRQRGFDWMTCGVCDTRVSLLSKKGRPGSKHTSLISKMDRAADSQREREVVDSILQGRSELGDFDVFLCYNVKDKAKVKEIGGKLKERGILPWLDEWELRPGVPWQRLLEKQIRQIKSAAVFIGKDGTGPWQHMELEAFLRQFVKWQRPVIPVILADAPKIPELPIFLEGMTWVDCRDQESDPIERLIWGITGSTIVSYNKRGN